MSLYGSLAATGKGQLTDVAIADALKPAKVEYHEFSDKNILKALATAGLFGNMIKNNASISGAEAACAMV